MFKRIGTDLFYEKTVSLVEALTGAHFHLPHLDERVLEVASSSVIKPDSWASVRVSEWVGGWVGGRVGGWGVWLGYWLVGLLRLLREGPAGGLPLLCIGAGGSAWAGRAGRGVLALCPATATARPFVQLPPSPLPSNSPPNSPHCLPACLPACRARACPSRGAPLRRATSTSTSRWSSPTQSPPRRRRRSRRPLGAPPQTARRPWQRWVGGGGGGGGRRQRVRVRVHPHPHLLPACCKGGRWAPITATRSSNLHCALTLTLASPHCTASAPLPAGGGGAAAAGGRHRAGDQGEAGARAPHW